MNRNTNKLAICFYHNDNVLPSACRGCQEQKDLKFESRVSILWYLSITGLGN